MHYKCGIWLMNISCVQLIYQARFWSNYSFESFSFSNNKNELNKIKNFLTQYFPYDPGAIILGSNLKSVDGSMCRKKCFADAAYMTCPSSGAQHLRPSCNCCLAPNGCTIYKKDGTPICTRSNIWISLNKKSWNSDGN